MHQVRKQVQVLHANAAQLVEPPEIDEVLRLESARVEIDEQVGASGERVGAVLDVAQQLERVVEVSWAHDGEARERASHLRALPRRRTRLGRFFVRVVVRAFASRAARAVDDLP